MHRVSIEPRWTIVQGTRDALSPRLLGLLVHVAETGSLAAACQKSGISYRHAWDMVRHFEDTFGTPLLEMERGRGSRLTPLGEKLVWADRRIAARLAPVLDTLASELEVELARVLPHPQGRLRIHASHGYSIEKLCDRLQAEEQSIERKWVSSAEAAASLHDGECDLAGFHVPIGPFEARAWESYSRWLDPIEHRVIDLTIRHQGLMVAAGNPKKIYGVADLARPGVRFVNRQRGSGTRFLLECLLEAAGIAPERLIGFEHGEHTHAAVAAFVGSGMADAAFGLELPARQFKLDFLPLARERYFVVARADALETPLVARALEILRSPGFRAEVDTLPGYDATHCGEVHPLSEVLARSGLV
jgi:molybdate transport repressor ModE-like protein